MRKQIGTQFDVTVAQIRLTHLFIILIMIIIRIITDIFLQLGETTLSFVITYAQLLSCPVMYCKLEFSNF